MTQEQVISNYIRFRLEGLKKSQYSYENLVETSYHLKGYGIMIRKSWRGNWYIKRSFWEQINKSFNLSLKKTKNIFNYYVTKNLGAKNPDCIYM